MLRQVGMRLAQVATDRLAPAASLAMQPSTSAPSGAWLGAIGTQLQQVAGIRMAKGDSAKDRSAKRKLARKEKREAKAGGKGDEKTAEQDGEDLSYEEEQAAVEKDAVRIVLQAIHNVTPRLDVGTVDVSTKTVIVPGLMPPRKGRSLAVRWLVEAAEKRRRSSKGRMADSLALELMLAYQKRGAARQKRDDLHRLALQNRTNMHRRWW